MQSYKPKYGPAMPQAMQKKRAAAQQAEYKKKMMTAMVPKTTVALRGFVGPLGEAKYVDTASASYALDTTGSVTHISIIPQGATVNNRDGRTCVVTAVHLRGNVNGRATCISCLGSILVVWDNQPNKALAAITDILDAKTSESQNKRENVNRFKIVRRLNFAVVGNDTTAGQQTSSTQFFVDEYIKLPKGCISVYTTADTTGVIGNCIQGALLLVSVGNTAAGNTAAISNLTIRTSFKDI